MNKRSIGRLVREQSPDNAKRPEERKGWDGYDSRNGPRHEDPGGGVLLLSNVLRHSGPRPWSGSPEVKTTRPGRLGSGSRRSDLTSGGTFPVLHVGHPHASSRRTRGSRAGRLGYFFGAVPASRRRSKATSIGSVTPVSAAYVRYGFPLASFE